MWVRPPPPCTPVHSMVRAFALLIFSRNSQKGKTTSYPDNWIPKARAHCMGGVHRTLRLGLRHLLPCHEPDSTVSRTGDIRLNKMIERGRAVAEFGRGFERPRDVTLGPVDRIFETHAQGERRRDRRRERASRSVSALDSNPRRAELAQSSSIIVDVNRVSCVEPPAFDQCGPRTVCDQRPCGVAHRVDASNLYSRQNFSFINIRCNDRRQRYHQVAQRRYCFGLEQHVAAP